MRDFHRWPQGEKCSLTFQCLISSENTKVTQFARFCRIITCLCQPSFMSEKMQRLSMLQVILLYIFITWNNILLWTQSCCIRKNMCKSKIPEEWKCFKKLTLYSNQCVWKMARNLDLEDDTKLAYEVQKYKCMYGKAYKPHLFLFLENSLLPKPNLSLFGFLSISS